MLTAIGIVFLLDVDNTLLDNDRFTADLTQQLDRELGREERERYWHIHAELRDSLGYVDYLGVLQKLRNDCEDDTALQKMAEFLLEYPFQDRLYPGALKVIEHLRSLGSTAILSDGDIVFQPRKITRAGLSERVDGQVLIVIHKERCLDLVQRRFPGSHHVMIDDKPHLLAAMKRTMGHGLTTVLVRQGHYAMDAESTAVTPRPDLCVAKIADICDLDPALFWLGGTP
ncbi:HAD family hydrolase [Perlucidibaca aquatica]|uniref:HAD family hydrolase n=1 Tax=Perlucidibaca aquatica TaxID=1852776 RepID=UPI000839D893|nr:HAD family hydrolase [Perlucidibaca aquatica]